ncbi:MAG: F0F1 ATP synthase subunit B [Myxococcota bacterium]|nr:F0F1 ATP synthase subunit B [Myxococcota bacterium]
MSYLLLASSLTEIRPGLIFWTLVTFILVAVVLRWKAWGPVLSLVEEREKQITNAVESAKRERAEAERLLAEQRTAIADARREAADMMRKSQADLEKFREQVMADARKKADEEIVNARRQINEEKLKALAEVKTSAVDLALAAAEKLLGERLDDAKHRQLATQFIDGLPKGSGAARV